MDIKSIAFYTVIILFSSSVLGMSIKAIPKILKGLFKLLVTLTFVTTIYKNFVFLKGLFPGINGMAKTFEFNNVLSEITFYFNQYFKTILNYIINYLN